MQAAQARSLNFGIFCPNWFSKNSGGAGNLVEIARNREGPSSAKVIMAAIKVGGRDISIFGVQASGQTLVSSAVALEFARLILRDRYGEEALAAQSPLTVEAEADEWVVRGSAPHAVGPSYPTDPKEHGQFEMRVAQLDGQIRRLIFNISFPEAAEFARKRREEHSTADMNAATDGGPSSPDTLTISDKGK
jgi:hypothetical protein